MTDNELKKWNKDAEDRIIKALECCMLSQCKGCPYVAEPLCHEQNCRDALDLITRQKAEIERLEKEYRIALETFTGLMSNQRKTNDKIIDFLQHIKDIRAEAIKEFAERVKGRIAYECGQYAVDEIDNLVKEMAGDV